MNDKIRVVTSNGKITPVEDYGKIINRQAYTIERLCGAMAFLNEKFEELKTRVGELEDSIKSFQGGANEKGKQS